MKCYKCGKEYENSNKFCPYCGNKKGIRVCNDCAHIVAEDHKFCGNCGANNIRWMQEDKIDLLKESLQGNATAQTNLKNLETRISTVPEYSFYDEFFDWREVFNNFEDYKTINPFEDYKTIYPTERYLFFDTETSGLPNNFNAPSSNTKNWPRLVQLSWIVTDDKGNKLKECKVVSPKCGIVRLSLCVSPIRRRRKRLRFSPRQNRKEIIQNGRLSNYWIWANPSPLALLTLASAPHFVEFSDGGSHDGRFIG